jgi:hypothetical protein
MTGMDFAYGMRAAKLRTAAGRLARAALCGAGLTFDEGDTPRTLHPYALNTASEPFPLQRGECGTWAIRNFVLYTRRGMADQAVGRPSNVTAPNLSSPQSAGYSSGSDDLFVIPVLLLAQPGRGDEEFSDGRVWGLGAFERGTFRNLKFAVREPSLRTRWKLQPASGIVDRAGVLDVANFVVSCGEQPCSGGELAEAADLAVRARTRDFPRQVQQQSAQRPAQQSRLLPQQAAPLVSTVVRLFDPRRTVRHRQVAGVRLHGLRRCELSDKAAPLRDGIAKVGVFHNVARGEPAGLCLVFDVNGYDRCYWQPLAEEGGRRVIPAQIDVPALSEESMSSLVCPPLPPCAIELKVTSLDGASGRR